VKEQPKKINLSDLIRPCSNGNGQHLEKKGVAWGIGKCKVVRHLSKYTLTIKI